MAVSSRRRSTAARLYRFSDDGAAGETNGDGVEDAFGGAGFVWRAAVVEAAAVGADTTTTAPDPYGGGYGGY